MNCSGCSPVAGILASHGGAVSCAAKLRRQGIEKWAKDRLLGAGSSTAPQDARPRARVLDQATLANKLLLYLACVNVDKGIGRGW
jgi:hypothetical protein